MTAKALAVLEAHFLRALDYAIFYGCTLSVEQFAACAYLDPDDLEQLRGHLERKGVAV